MAQLPTSFNAPQSNISDGSNLISAALGLNRDINKFGNKAFSTISDFAKEQANQALAGTFASNIANGMDPTSAMQGALEKVNSWTSAEAINNLATQRNYEQASLRKEALLDIQKAQENRAVQDWEGMNEASEANLLLKSGYNTNNSNTYNQGLSKASGLSDRAKKFIEMSNLAQQQDNFATSALSRANTKAQLDSMEKKKLASQLDARFRVLESQNSGMPKIQLIQEVAHASNLSPDQVIQLLTEYRFESGQSVLNESSKNTSFVPDPETVKTYNKYKSDEEKLKVDINSAVRGNTEQNIEDTNTGIDILSEELSNITDNDPDAYLGGAAYTDAGNPPGLVFMRKEEAKELVSSLLKDPSKKNFESIKKRLEAKKGSKGHYLDWLNSTFIVENDEVKLSPNTATNINNTLKQQVIGDSTRGDSYAKSQIELSRVALGMNRAFQRQTYERMLTLAQKPKHLLTREEQQELADLRADFARRNLELSKLGEKVANTTLVQNPTQQVDQTIETFSDIVESRKVITPEQLIKKGLTESQANAVVKRIRDAVEEAKDSKEFSNLSMDAIAYAVLDDFTNAEGAWYDLGSKLIFTKKALKRAASFQDKLIALKALRPLVSLAQEEMKIANEVNAKKRLGGQ